MTHRLFARLHVWLVLSTTIVVGRLRSAPQRGQATVEYVALILLVAGVLAVAVAAANAKGFNLGQTVADQLNAAVKKVSGGG